MMRFMIGAPMNQITARAEIVTAESGELGRAGDIAFGASVVQPSRGCWFCAFEFGVFGCHRQVPWNGSDYQGAWEEPDKRA